MTQHPQRPNARSRSTVAAGAVATALLGLSGLLVPASAVPSQAERDQAQADVATQTDRVSVLADYPCYHWMLRDRETNASANEFDPTVYYANLREVLDIVAGLTLSLLRPFSAAAE